MANTNDKHITTTNEKQALYKAIWKIADDLRGAIDGWDFKTYVLGTMFYRFLSESFATRVNDIEAKANSGLVYQTLSDNEARAISDTLAEEFGYFIAPSELFESVVARCDKDDDLNVTIATVFRNIEASTKGHKSEDDFKGLFSSFRIDDEKFGATVDARNRRLRQLLHGVADMPLGAAHEADVDAFGDAYEFLMGMYAANAGKSGGEYFTPSEVSELLTKLGTVGKKEVLRVYDPTCGSGSLLLKATKILGRDSIKVGFFGQEFNPTTYNLCRINMFLHGIDFDRFDIRCGDTLIDPQHFDDKPFDLIVSNPPYSTKWVGDDDPTLINDDRFSPAGVLAPKSKADLAFVMHSLSWLSEDGTAAIVCFPGVMYRSGAEQQIRKYLVDNDFVDAVIQLPDNLFFGTSIATDILVLKRNKPHSAGVLFIDASKQCQKVTKKNVLTNDNIDTIVDWYANRVDVEYAVKVVSNETIAKNNYNLSVSTYVENEDTREKVDIVALNEEIDRIVKRENELRAKIDEIVKRIEG